MNTVALGGAVGANMYLLYLLFSCPPEAPIRKKKRLVSREKRLAGIGRYVAVIISCDDLNSCVAGISIEEKISLPMQVFSFPDSGPSRGRQGEKIRRR